VAKRLTAFLLAATVAAAALSSRAIVAQDAFHVTFGTTGDPGSRYADGATFVVETDRGDIVVAGGGATYFSDDGITGRSYPLLARFSSRGELAWQRVYTDLESHRVMAVLSAGEEQYVVLRDDSESSGPEPVPTPLSLRRVDQGGDVSESLGELQGFTVLEAFPITGAEPYFLIVGIRPAAGSETALDVKLFRFDVRAKITEQRAPADIDSIQDFQHAGGGELLLSRWRPRGSAGASNRPLIDTEIVRMRGTGETEVVATIPERLCRSVASSPNRVFCVAYSPEGTDQPDVLIAYSMGGTELWRHDLERGVRVEQMRALQSGELVYSYPRDMDAIVNRISTSGGLLWMRLLRSTGPYTYLLGIAPLRNGRLALFGFTGPSNAFGSMDTDAMLVVIDIADGDVGAKIVSTVVGSP